MVDGIYNTQLFFYKISMKKHNKNFQYLLSNLRMSICELG